MDRLKTHSPSPLAVATNGGSGTVSPLATPIPVSGISSPSSSAWSRRPLAAQSASSAPSSLIQVKIVKLEVQHWNLDKKGTF